MEYTKVESISDIFNNKLGLKYDMTDFNDDHWFLTENEEFRDAYNFAQQNFPNIKDEIRATNGIQTSKNSVYKINKSSITEITDNSIKFQKNDKEFEIEKDILREYYLPSQNRKIKKSYQKLEATNYVIFPYKNGKIIPSSKMETLYPKTWDYLNFYKDQLLPKSMSGKRDVKGNENNMEWYQYGRSQSLKEVDEEKIIVGVLSKEPNFNIDRNNMAYASGGTAGYIGLYLKEESEYNLEYIQGWLSHNFTDQIFKIIGGNFEGGYYSHGTATYDYIPLLPIDFSIKSEVDAFNAITNKVQSIEHLNEEIEFENNHRKKEILERVKQSEIDSINSIFNQLLDEKVSRQDE